MNRRQKQIMELGAVLTGLAATQNGLMPSSAPSANKYSSNNNNQNEPEKVVPVNTSWDEPN